MIGAVTFWTFFGISIWIDLLTAFVFLFIPNKEINTKDVKGKVSVLIPIHTESANNIRRTIDSIYKEGYPIKRCIVCGDSDSVGISELIAVMSIKYKNLGYLDSPEKSKAKKMNYTVEYFNDSLGDFLYVRDCNVVSEGKCIEDLVSNFKEDDIAAVTSYGFVDKPSNFLGRSYHYGKEWINQIGRFRKHQQEKRKSIFVVCGASTIYRVEVMRRVPIPYQTKTEDTHYTWLLQIHGYRISIAKKTKVSSPDVDGERFLGIKNQIRQSYRWSCGTVQSFYIERKNLNKNKKLLYTTIIPGSIEAITYSVALILLPIFAIYLPSFFFGFLIGDAFFSLLATIIFIPKRFFHTLFHYHQIFFFKYLNSAIFLTALSVVSYQRLTKKNHKWSNEWKSSS